MTEKVQDVIEEKFGAIECGSAVEYEWLGWEGQEEGKQAVDYTGNAE